MVTDSDNYPSDAPSDSSTTDNRHYSQHYPEHSGGGRRSYGIGDPKVVMMVGSNTATATAAAAHESPGATAAKSYRTTTFNLEPEIIPRLSTASSQHRHSDISNLTNSNYELDSPTEHQLKEIRERSRQKVRRLVAVVGISLTVLCVVLVIVSLSFGPKLEELSSQSRDRSPFSTNQNTLNLIELTKNLSLINQKPKSSFIKKFRR